MAKIVSYKRGRKTQKMNQAIASIEKVSNREEAGKYIGKRVEIAFSKTSIKGVVVKPHGNRGKVVIRFRRGLPGQAMNREIKLD
ncbi:MAG: Ribosomal protein L35Ae [Candidatus Parvarchaeum acidophilus ARMAN-5]|jgi:large subunit ribosomal protein L35Ae|uniref:Large ribosomal subunit protein eL33 n=1 Tax=Candidatus Parvarchaeum acidophilus ARMAN-5 TaxID=662762 RepID=D6GUZ9_PARA5|nr:MAG: Ribosomal protein L35Ae [Candidatus Parvarchaeum acidophilus ARMAN-5]